MKDYIFTCLKSWVATGSGPNSARSDETGWPPQKSSLFGERPTMRCGILLVVRSIVRLDTGSSRSGGRPVITRSTGGAFVIVKTSISAPRRATTRWLSCMIYRICSRAGVSPSPPCRKCARGSDLPKIRSAVVPQCCGRIRGRIFFPGVS